VPELADLADDKAIHDPSTAPDGLPPDYPAPIVDHAAERAESLRRYQAL
jgi:deoxyribodipyrimidine photo-lyase